MAKSQPVEFGTTPWGRDWVKRVEPIKVTRPNPLLPKARSLVRGGHATVELEAGKIAVLITISSKQHTVSITVPKYTAAEKKRVLQQLNAAGVASTASGDLPDALHEKLLAEQLAPVPDSIAAMCTCASKVPPCIHVTTAAYAVGVFMDRTPLDALTFRGVLVPTEQAHCGSTQPDRWVMVTELNASAYFGGQGITHPTGPSRS